MTLYKFKMFILWILQNLHDYVTDNAEGLLSVLLLYSVIFTAIFGFIDLGLADLKLQFIGQGWLSIILRLIAYPSMIGFTFLAIIIGFRNLYLWIEGLKQNFTAFTIEGPKKKKKNINDWVETPEHSNPLDSMDASDFYFDDKDVFDDDQFDEDFQRHLDEVNRRHNKRGSKT